MRVESPIGVDPSVRILPGSFRSYSGYGNDGVLKANPKQANKQIPRRAGRFFRCESGSCGAPRQCLQRTILLSSHGAPRNGIFV
jgi:hypothetical protein